MEPLTCCPRCGHQNTHRARYCAGCGLNLAAAGAAAQVSLPGKSSRRRLWVMLGLVVAALAIIASVLR